MIWRKRKRQNARRLPIFSPGSTGELQEALEGCLRCPCRGPVAGYSVVGTRLAIDGLRSKRRRRAAGAPGYDRPPLVAARATIR